MATVRKRGKSYQIRVSCGYDIAGKQIVKTLNWTPPEGLGARQLKKELDRQTILFEEQCRSRIAPSGSIKLADYIDQWLINYAEMRLKDTTVAGYRHFRQRTVAALGHLHLDKITPNHLNAFYRNLLDEGVRNIDRYQCDNFKAVTKAAGVTAKAVADKAHVHVETLYGLNRGKNVCGATARKIAAALSCTVGSIFTPAKTDADLSKNTVNHYHKFLSSVLSTAVKQGLIHDNPCARADPPVCDEDEPAYLQEDDLQVLIQALAHEHIKYRTAVYLLLDSGMRRGEILGLEWNDIHWDSCTVTVRRNSVYLPKRGVYTDTPKTRESKRTIKLPQETFDMLSQYRSWQDRQRLRLGDKWHDHDRLFTTWDGHPMNPSTLTHWFTDFARRISMPEGITLHSLRHTNASLMIANGTNIRTVSARLGHAQTSTTTNIYAHVIQSADAAASAAIGSIVHQK